MILNFCVFQNQNSYFIFQEICVKFVNQFIYSGFVHSMKYLEKYGINLSIFQGHEKYEIQSCGMEKNGFSGVF